MNYVPHRVLLPQWIFDQAKGNKDEIRRLVLTYMQRYPNYRTTEIRGSFAICERKDEIL